MLILTRRIAQSIEVMGPCTITLVDVRGERALIGVEADRDVKILRTELKLKTETASVASAAPNTAAGKVPAVLT
jgi:carbon storage regulator CsrA